MSGAHEADVFSQQEFKSFSYSVKRKEQNSVLTEFISHCQVQFIFHETSHKSPKATNPMLIAAWAAFFSVHNITNYMLYNFNAVVQTRKHSDNCNRRITYAGRKIFQVKLSSEEQQGDVGRMLSCQSIWKAKHTFEFRRTRFEEHSYNRILGPT